MIAVGAQKKVCKGCSCSFKYGGVPSLEMALTSVLVYHYGYQGRRSGSEEMSFRATVNQPSVSNNKLLMGAADVTSSGFTCQQYLQYPYCLLSCG